MIETFLNGKVMLHAGDSRDVLKTLGDCSIDSIVTDPPYALVSIVKRFGKSGSAAVKVPEGGSGAYARASAGFMGKQWDTGETAFAVEFWAECLRVLKPGGHVAAFSGTRTYHRMACAIEDAGFEIRDQLAWCYGSGFPKSHDVSKGIDKAAGAEREVVGVNRGAMSGWNTDGGTKFIDRAITAPATDAAREWEGWGTALKPSWEPICFARKPLIGTVAENVLGWGTGALNIDGCRVEAEKATGWGGKGAGGNTWNETNNGLGKDGEARPVEGRWPANIVHDGSDEVVAAFPNIKTSKATVTSKPGSVYGNGAGLPSHTGTYGFDESGSAARFFYTAKADKQDRMGSKHPTVKPVDLMQWLCRLITPPGGTVLDPFAGSGSTGEAAWREGFQCVLIEREPEYQADIRRRMTLCLAGPEERARESIKAKIGDRPIDAGPLFGGLDTPPRTGRRIYGVFADEQSDRSD